MGNGRPALVASEERRHQTAHAATRVIWTPATDYLREVGRVLGPLQITHGGPILMVQVENEYGFFGRDAEYMGAMRQALIDAGFDVPLFACNPPE